MLNLDTHILINALVDNLSRKERLMLRSKQWSISAIVLWEIAKLKQLKRIELDLDSHELQRIIAKIQVWPIDLEVCRESTKLDFRGDPADELIAATSVVHKIPLLTRDRAIRRSKKVPLA